MCETDLRELLEQVRCGELSVSEAVDRLGGGSCRRNAPADGQLAGDSVQVIETHIDDMNPELLGFLMERLFAEGALDVAFSPLQMKKNRPAVRLTVISPPSLLDHLSRVILLESTAIGVRHYPAGRFTLERASEIRETSLGPVRVKVLGDKGTVLRIAPEYEECRRLARETGRPLSEIYRLVEREAGVSS